MRKISLIILAAIALTFSSCRKTPDYVPYLGGNSDLAYSTYSEQFDVLWNNINTGYVFWDVDTTDWDAVYEEYMPKFEELDMRKPWSVTTEELQVMYEEIMGGLVDHHMLVKIKNLYPVSMNLINPSYVVSINPANNEIKKRDYYYKESHKIADELSKFNKNLASNSVSGYKVAYSGYEKVNTAEVQVTVCYILFELPDGRYIPYLWQNGYKMSVIMSGLNNATSPYYKAAQLIDKWKNAALKTSKNKLAGVILDNRCNNGGYLSDLNYVVSPFIKKDLEVIYTRYKEGPGRLEHSVWSPVSIKASSENRDLASENIPYVVLSNIYSISMGEITTYNISQMPTGYVIGERTYGATGPLVSDAIDMTYGGPFGDIETESHYVYTSTYEIKTHEGFVPEGVGFTPDKEVLTKNVGVQGQLDAALEYIRSYK